MKIAFTLANVTTLWSKPGLPRPIDALAISQPADIPAWLSKMSSDDRQWLIKENVVQTQALYGTKVFVIEEQDEWCHCLLPDQPSPKNKFGYPGWIPTKQLVYHSDYDQSYHTLPSLWVTSLKATLNTENEILTLPYLTRLPYLYTLHNRVYTMLPTGATGWLLNKDTTVCNEPHYTDLFGLTAPYPMLPAKSGMDIVETGKQFLGLTYLWSGMSSFGYDCSGFTHSMHKANGILIPRDASAQFKYGKQYQLEIEKDEMLAGDLVYFANEQGIVDHVGIYAGKDYFLHASNSNDYIMLEPLWESRYAERFCGCIRFW